jgi:hypothetical protein
VHGARAANAGFSCEAAGALRFKAGTHEQPLRARWRLLQTVNDKGAPRLELIF